MDSKKETFLREKMGDEWFELLKKEFDKDYMLKLSEGLKAVRQRKIIYPDAGDIFKAFKMTPFSEVKVCLFGQDPYFKGEANGLAFDCSKAEQTTPSWDKILKQYTKEFPRHFATDMMEGNLERWAKQGVFLLNVSLTVPRGNPGKHLNHWQPFTSRIMDLLLNDQNPKLFALLGSWAKGIEKWVVPPHGCAVYEHPAYAARQERDWKADNFFFKINDFLEKEGRGKIDW